MDRTAGTADSQAAAPHRPPAPLRKIEAQLLARAFARTFGMRAPSLRGLSADEATERYLGFTAEQIGRALALRDRQPAEPLRARLGAEALTLGRLVRRAVPGAAAHPLAAARYLYAGIGITMVAESAEDLRFGPCACVRHYTPATCWFMSAFDEGFLRGITGREADALTFSCRLTEGATCCRARLEPAGDPAASAHGPAADSGPSAPGTAAGPASPANPQR